MPLTLLEVIAAIKALDTEPDVILNACAKIVAPKAPSKITDYKETAEYIFDLCTHRKLETAHIVRGCLLICARLAGATAKITRHREVLNGLQEALTEEFADAFTTRIARNLRLVLRFLDELENHAVEREQKSREEEE
jgi:hypothetical protein